jgi:hypothetical protein
MHDNILFGHKFSMIARGTREPFVPFRKRQAFRGPFVIQGIKQRLFSIGNFLLRDTTLRGSSYAYTHKDQPERAAQWWHGNIFSALVPLAT